MSGGRGRCPFCAIVAGDAEGALIYDDALVAAFLDHRPLFPGHTLVVPRAHVQDFAEAPAATLGALFSLAQRLSAVMTSALGAEGSFVALNDRVSQSVPHLHVHVVPRRRKDGLRGFFWPRTRYASQAAREEVAALLRAALGR